jgi:hypothetical protein
MRSKTRFLRESLRRARQVEDERGYVRMYLGRGFPYANTGGWAWRHRFVVQVLLGRKLLKSEHVHHLNKRKGDDRPSNLAVVDVVYHGRLHAHGILVMERGQELPEPISIPVKRSKWLVELA